jgi:plasmid stabilization system protein ParE
MMRSVILTARAERELEESARWWANHRSAEQAARWLAGFQRLLATLSARASGCVLAAESSDFRYELREIHYGAGPRPTHRAVFTIVESLVIVLTVRHAAQDQLKPEDLDEDFDAYARPS